MKRLVVFLMLLALPLRTVLAVSGFGCAMMPMQIPQAGPASAPCLMHMADGAQVSPDVETPLDSEPASCPSCSAACCTALAPVPAAIVGTFSSDDVVLGVVETSFANAVRHTLERPPRAV